MEVEVQKQDILYKSISQKLSRIPLFIFSQLKLFTYLLASS